MFWKSYGKNILYKSIVNLYLLWEVNSAGMNYMIFKLIIKNHIAVKYVWQWRKNPYYFSENSPSTWFDVFGLYKDSAIEWLKENCKYIAKYSSLCKVDPYALSMAMAEEYDDYQSWPIKWATDWVQDNIIENILPDNA